MSESLQSSTVEEDSYIKKEQQEEKVKKDDERIQEEPENSAEEEIIIPSNCNKSDRKKGYYFKPQPDIIHQNKNLGPRKRAAILLNGHMRDAIPIDGNYYLLCNSCSFDSIMQILAVSGMDDAAYLEFIRVFSSSSETMNFLWNFIDKGVTPALCKQRTVILKNLFPNQITAPKKNYPVSYLFPHELNIYPSTADIWTKCFESNPSGFDHYNCSQCGPYTVPKSTLWVNVVKIRNEGIGILQDALYQKATGPCNRCVGTCPVRTVFNNHVFIELNLLRHQEEVLKFKLDDVPSKIRLNNIQYR